MKKIVLVEIDADKGVFKLYGIEQSHKPYMLKAKITYGVDDKIIEDLIRRIEVYVER